MLVYCLCVSEWDILRSLQSAIFFFSLLIQLVGFHWSWLTFYSLFFLSSLLTLLFHHFCVISCCFPVLLSSFLWSLKLCLPTPPLLLSFTLAFLLLLLLLLLLPDSLLPLVDPSDCRVKLWSYVPGLTPCLPRRVLAIKGRATSLPWLPLLCSPTLPSSGTLLTNFHLLFPAAFLFPYFYISFPRVVPELLCLLLFCFYPPFHFCSDPSNILSFCFFFLLFYLFTCCSVWLSLTFIIVAGSFAAHCLHWDKQLVSDWTSDS